MGYQVLARKWRPKNFSDVIGQQHIIQSIKHSFLLNKIHHAYIFSGMRGTGKTTIARLFAKGLNCVQGITANMCRKCKNCQDIESGCFIDLIEIDGASRTRVEDTRDFLDSVQYVPSQGRFKVYIIDEAHMLSRHSFNALLKTLEEPPLHVKFILVTTENQKLPETILSRCLQFYLKPLDVSQIITQLTYIFNKEHILSEESAVASLAYAAKGSVRDALSLSEQAIVLGNNKITAEVIDNMFGMLNMDYVLLFLENLIDKDIHKIMDQIDKYSILGINWDYFLIELLTILQKMAINQFLSNSSTQENGGKLIYNKRRIYDVSARITPEIIQLYYQIFLLGRKELPYAPNYKMGIEMIVLRALAFHSEIDPMDEQHDDNMIVNNISINSNDVKKNRSIYKEQEQNAIINFNKDCNNHIEKNNNSLKKKIKCENDNSVLRIGVTTSESSIIKETVPMITSSITSQAIIPDITATLLEARAKLLKRKEYNQSIIKKNLNLSVNTQKSIPNILKRFNNIDKKNAKNDIDNFDLFTQKVLKYSFSNDFMIKNDVDHRSYTSDVMGLILQKAINSDIWTKQIYQLSLPKSAKKLVMHTWQKISSNAIHLYLHSNYRYLNDVMSHTIIQKELSKNMKKSIKLIIEENDDSSIKTPMEYIYMLYNIELDIIKQKYSNDAYIKMIKKFFDVDLDEDDITFYRFNHLI